MVFFEDPTVLAFEQRISNRDFVLEKCKIASYSALSLMFSKKTVEPSLIETINRSIDKIKQTQKYQNEWGW